MAFVDAESVLQESSDKKQKEKQPSEVFYKKGCLKNLTKFTGKLLCWKESCRPESYNFIEKEISIQMFRTPFFTEHLPTTAS